MAALLLAVRAEMRSVSGMNLDEPLVDVMPTGRPPAVAGELFYAIHDGGETQLDDLSMEEESSFTITASMRGGRLPYDRWGTELIAEATTGLLDKCRTVAAHLHMNEDVRVAANVIIGASENGFTETIRYLGRGIVEEKYGDWWHGGQRGQAPDGVAVQLRFGKLKRYQVISEQS